MPVFFKRKDCLALPVSRFVLIQAYLNFNLIDELFPGAKRSTWLNGKKYDIIITSVQLKV